MAGAGAGRLHQHLSHSIHHAGNALATSEGAGEVSVLLEQQLVRAYRRSSTQQLGKASARQMPDQQGRYASPDQAEQVIRA